MKKVVSVLLACILLLLTGCNSEPSEEEKFLEQVRAEGQKYDFLSSCYSAVYSLSDMFGMWNDDTYQKAKSGVRLSSSLKNTWFHSDKWMGNDLTNQSKLADIKEVVVTSATEEDVAGLLRVSVRNNVMNTTTVYLYNFAYNRTNNEVYLLEELDSYKDWS